MIVKIGTKFFNTEKDIDNILEKICEKLNDLEDTPRRCDQEHYCEVSTYDFNNLENEIKELKDKINNLKDGQRDNN